MIRRFPTPLRFIAGFLAIAVTGCTPTVTRIETEVSPDGSISRAFLQADELTPDEAIADASWDEVTWLDGSEAREFSDPIRTLNAASKGEGDQYAAAWGMFSSVDDVPDHYIRSSDYSKKSSRLKRDLQITDYGIVTEYLWAETLTDRVNRDDFQEARTELFRLLSAFYEYILSEGMSSEYEVSKLVRWLRTDGRDWFYSVTDALYESGIPVGPDEENEFKKELVRISLRHGLCPPGHTPEEFQTEDGDYDIEKAAPIVIGHHVKRRDGKALTDDEMSAVFKVFFLDFDSEKPLEARLENARQEAVERFPGGPEALEKKQWQLSTKMFGVQGAGYMAMERFDCVLTVPGQIVETSGELQSESTVRWEFSAVKAWPRGYEMRCRSLLDRTPRPGDQQSPPSKLSRRQMLKVIGLLADDDELREVLTECRKDRTLEPLRTLVDRDGDESAAAEVLSVLMAEASPTEVLPQ